MDEGMPHLIRRDAYSAPAYWIRSVELSFDLDPAKTLVTSRMRVERNTEVGAEPLRLHGEELNLLRVQADGQSVSFRTEDGMLVIDAPAADAFTLEIRNTCAPERNTALSGLYTSGGGLFTQCEAQGFRRITYFLDRPDVMCVYTVTLRANRAAFPVLLCNGNLVVQGELEGGRHFATWHDPFPKPSYLFALVAADLVAREQPIRTRAGRDHLLQIFVRRRDLDKTEHAMNSLIASIVWDEARFGLALDLERFMIVAVGDFNMGAMENKGLNLFNTDCVLASPAVATDDDYAGIESIVGHEYFHNWSGNRVTCRDWFQLSLKEGLTVFRDQEFSMDMAGSASASAVKRITDVRQLRYAQFPEDAGPMAHPVRPDAYVEISNFYTATVYEKGAEVVRMMQTLVGRDGFARGMTQYVQRHDGQAVTCDDFAQAMADANPGSALAANLAQFKRWYSQPGTPRVNARGRYDAQSRSYTLALDQQLPARAGAAAEPLVIPVRVGLLTSDGRAIALRLEGEAAPAEPVFERVLVLDAGRNFFTFVDVDAEPVPSLLRGFSAPVILSDTLGDAELLTLLQHDSDAFNRWEAGQRMALSRLLAALREGRPPTLDAAFAQAMRGVLRDPQLDPAFKALLLTLPSESYIAEQLDAVDPPAIHAARRALQLELAQHLRDDWHRAYETHHASGPYSPDAASAGRRSLANLALSMACLDAQQRGEAEWPERATRLARGAGNMTDRQGAVDALIFARSALAHAALAHYYALFRNEPDVIDKWFALQAGMPEHEGSVLARVRELLRHPDFSLRNPNRARSLIGTFCNANRAAFHRADGAGYAFWADRVIELDAVNPQLASRIARAMDRWSTLVEPYRGAAREALARVAARPDLSNDVREIVERALATPA
ncbi:MAG TPA: aminopeptidase N [Burkholderiaceae bacterium]|nr:aminopeptidase N [Burkholderiaceae bacterium]